MIINGGLPVNDGTRKTKYTREIQQKLFGSIMLFLMACSFAYKILMGETEVDREKRRARIMSEDQRNVPKDLASFVKILDLFDDIVKTVDEDLFDSFLYYKNSCG